MSTIEELQQKHREKIELALSSKESFGETVYTEIWEAVRELKERQNNKDLDKILSTYFKNGIPKEMESGIKVVLFRQIMTPNYELRRFMCVPDTTEIEPLFFEYHEDKFTPNNPIKHHLGKMGMHYGIGKKGGIKSEYKKIIDFNSSNGKKIKEINTIWGQSLIDFHHHLLDKFIPSARNFIFDASSWFHENGQCAKEYYKQYVALFIKNAILFENFVLEGEELEFTKNIFLPYFFEVWERTGKKPLVVALEPTEIESDIFWMCHPPETMEHIENKLNNENIVV